mgnify:CR=1 FL=1
MRPPILLALTFLLSAPIWAQDTVKADQAKSDNELIPTRAKVPEALLKNGYVQRGDSLTFKEKVKAISLTDVIEKGIRANYTEQERKHEKEILDIGWEDSWSDFWMPQLTLTLSTSEQRVGTLKKGGIENSRTSDVPGGVLGLSMGDYTVFNWGKDYLAFLNTKTTYNRSTKKLKELRRDLKHDLIIKYFEVAAFQEIQTLRKEQLRHSSFVYRLNREKITLKKIRKQDYYQARAEYLRAQTDFHQSKVDASVVEEELAEQITDAPGTKYLLRERLVYQPLNTTIDESMAMVSKSNTIVLDALSSLTNAKRNYDLTLRENLPLPKFTVNLGAYNHSFGQNQLQTRYETNAGRDIELVATINASWTITGSGGFFNGRKTRKASLQKSLALKKLQNATHGSKSDIRIHYRKIRHLQNQMTILRARTSNLQKTFDTILENYLNKRARYNDFHHALNEKIDVEILMEQTKFLHAREKLLLAKTIGIEDFPGENFEKMAKPLDKEK